MEVILQSESSECGLACLAMVASHHGNPVGVRDLRRRFPLSLKGAPLKRLIAIAGELDLQCRPLRLDLDNLSRLAKPCLLHWDLNHYVVLVKIRGDRVTIHDPAIGRCVLPLAEISKHFTGVALELEPTAAFKRQPRRPAISIRQLTGRVRGLGRTLLLLLTLSFALQVFVLLAPFFMQWVVDQVLVAADRDLLGVLGIGFGLALLLQVSIGVLRSWIVIHLSARLGMQWMRNVFVHLMRLPLDFFEKRHLGDMTSRMGSVQEIQRTLTTSFVEVLIDGVMAVVTFSMMLLYSWKLALATLLAVGLYLGLRWLAYGAVRGGTEQQLVSAAKQQSHLLESIRGIQSVKIANCEPLRQATYANLMHDTVNCEVKLARLGIAFSSSSQLIFGVERIAVIWIGAVLALQNVFSVGMLVAYLAYKDQFAQRVAGLIDKWVEFRMLRLHGERLADIALATPELDGCQSGDFHVPDVARLEVAHLSFRYADGEPWILKDCCFTVEDGESVAIVGASGAGKTTLVKLLLGLLCASSGSIIIDGRDVRRIGARHYRSWFGAVMQDDQLFAGSVADNIAFGEDGYDLQRVKDAARLAAVHEDIAAMPMGYHSLIGDMGTVLSGGQKQRVILARALYRNPRFLLLDEATSHLDVTRERLVSAAVQALKLTRIIIAHRPETIASADRVLVLQDGRIAEEFRPRAQSMLMERELGHERGTVSP